MANTIFTQKSTCLAVGTFGRSRASKVDHPTRFLRFKSRIKDNRFSSLRQNIGLSLLKNCASYMNLVVYANISSETPRPADPSPGHWKVWILGTVITALLSFTRGKWGPLLQLKKKIDTTIDQAQLVADIVEEVAEGVEKVAEDAAKNLPEGKLQDAAEFIENVAENIDKSAENAQDALEKAENMVEELESFFESATQQEKTTVVTTEAKDQK